MKRLTIYTAPVTPSQQKVTVSKRELERLVEQEVQRAVKEKNNTLDELIENFQSQLSQGLTYETSIKTLQSRMLAVVQRAEVALEHLEQNSEIPSVSTTVVESEVESTVPKTEPYEVSVEASSVSEFMEKTKKEFERLHAENAALKAAFENMKERTPSPAMSQQSEAFEGLSNNFHIKKEPADSPENSHSSIAAEPSVSVKRPKEGSCSPEKDRLPKKIKSETGELSCHTLPTLPFPTSLPLEAYKYSPPSKLKVKLALIKNPSPTLSVLWNLDREDPSAPPMKSYSVYCATEQFIGSGVFEEWQKVAELAAMPLPMFYLYMNYRPGYKICVSVVGKDSFGRYGPYSEVICTIL